MYVKRLCRDPPKKNVHFVIGFAYVNHYENGINYACSYRKLAELSHGTIRIELSFINLSKIVFSLHVCKAVMLQPPPTKKKKVHFVIGSAYVNHYENDVNYTCFYRKFTQLSHGTIRIDLSFTVFEQLMIYYNNVVKNFISANFNSLYWAFIFISLYF